MLIVTRTRRIGISTSSSDGGIDPGLLARAVEERGFEWLLFDDHSYFQAHVGPALDLDPAFRDRLPRVRDLFVVLSYAAAATTTLTVGSGVALLPQRDILHAAKAVATLATLSGDRLILGVGVGWNVDEMRNHGVEPSTRGDMLDEQLDALRLLATEDVAEYRGKHVQFDAIVSSPRPAIPIPVYIGGSSRAALRRAVRFGAGWLPLATTEPAEIVRTRERFVDHGRGDLAVAVSETPGDPALAAAFFESGCETVLFHLEPGSPDDVFRSLDNLAHTAERALQE